MYSLLATLATAVLSVAAIPYENTLSRRQGLGVVSTVTALTDAQITSFVPFAQFARAAYCDVTTGTNCGDACTANPGFTVTAHGGDGDGVQKWYVGYWPDYKAVVVAHEGTDPTQFLADLTDANFFLNDFNPTLFPGLPSSVQGHSGFLAEHALTAKTILGEVKSLLSKYNSKLVYTVGHSLGGALAQLDALFLKLNLDSSITIKSETFGTPRVGNPAYAAYFDSLLAGNFHRVNNGKDIVPIVPGRFLGFLHPEGETHFLSEDSAVACPGEDDAVDSQCQITTVPNILDGDILDHLGPYHGVWIGTLFC